MKQAAIGIIYNSDRTEVLLTKRCDVPVWVLPGGGIEEGEFPENAVIREVWEETGLRVEVIRKIAEYTPVNCLSKKTFLFECRKIDGCLRTGCETAAIHYYPLNALPPSLFIVHEDWINDALSAQTTVLQKPIWRVTYLGIFKYFCRHPLRVLRFLIHK